MTAEQLLATMPPVTVADRIMVAVTEGRPVDPEDAATLATWVQDAHASRVTVARGADGYLHA